MAWNAAWYAANTRAGDKYKGDAGTNDVGFKKHSGDMSKAVTALELKLSQNALDDIKWGAWNAAWHAANERNDCKQDAENDFKHFEFYYSQIVE